jgi:hypothetical protein
VHRDTQSRDGSLQRAAALGSVYGRAADADASGDLLIAGAAIHRQQNLRAFELAVRKILDTTQVYNIGGGRSANCSMLEHVPPELTR